MAFRRPPRRVLLLFPSTSERHMNGSVGELTALMRLASRLPPDRFHITYVECVRGDDPDPRVASLLVRGSCECLHESGSERRPDSTFDSGLVRQRLERLAPDVVIASSYRAFFQNPRFPLLSACIAAWCDSRSIGMVPLDPCGDSIVDGVFAVPTLMPVPFTYAVEQPTRHLPFSAARPLATHPRSRAWLWASASWMRYFPGFRAAEQIGVRHLVNLGVEVSLLNPVTVAVPQGCRRLSDEHLGFDDIDHVVAQCAVLITANHRSTLAARAAALGTPIVWLNWPELDPSGQYSSELNADIAQIERSETAGGPIPTEFAIVSGASPDATRNDFERIRSTLHELTNRQRCRAAAYRAAPSPGDQIDRLVEGGSRFLT